MKTIVLVALLATVGCSKKAASSDCDAPINKGMDNFTATVKSRGSNMPMQTMMLGVVDKLRATFLERCHEDKWSADVAKCFETVASQADVKACQSKLTEEQRTKLVTQVREIMMGSMRMPGSMPGHPQMLQGSAAPGTPDPAAGSGAAPAAGSGAAPAAPAAGSGAAPAAGSGAAPAAGSGSAAPAGGW